MKRGNRWRGGCCNEAKEMLQCGARFAAMPQGGCGSWKCCNVAPGFRQCRKVVADCGNATTLSTRSLLSFTFVQKSELNYFISCSYRWSHVKNYTISCSSRWSHALLFISMISCSPGPDERVLPIDHKNLEVGSFVVRSSKTSHSCNVWRKDKGIWKIWNGWIHLGLHTLNDKYQ